MTDSERLADLERRVAELERIALCGDGDRVLAFEETVRRATTKSVSTVRDWLRRPAKRRALRLDLLFVKDAGGRLTSTPRRVASWQSAMRQAVTR